jgi:hypothetical protein
MRRVLSVALTCSTLLLAGVAAADEAPVPEEIVPGEISAPPPEETRPWAEGVSPEDQTKALELFEQGNQLFLKSSYSEAKAIYENALKSWDHPAIRFNLSECLIHLDRTVEAYEQLMASLKFGAEPLGPEVFKRAQLRQKLLEGQLSTVEISCEEVGARVTFNGEELFVAPGSAKRQVQPGRHHVVAEKDGFMTYTNEMVALPKEAAQLAIELQPVVVEGPVQMERRWPRWMPWTVAGAGLALAATGGILQLKSSSTISDYDDRVVDECPTGCAPGELSEETRDLKDRAELESSIGIPLLAVGAAAVAAGTVLVILNQPRRVETSKGVEVGAAVTPDAGWVSLTWGF